MKITVESDSGEVLWSRGPGAQGVANPDLKTMDRIIAALVDAVEQARGQAGLVTGTIRGPGHDTTIIR